MTTVGKGRTYINTGYSGSYPIADGSFIQDALVRKWNDEQWKSELRYLKEAGMHYLIFAPAAYAAKDGEYKTVYPTSISGCSMHEERDLMDICLRNAQEVGIKVFIGLNFHNDWWTKHADDEEWLYDQMKIGNLIADELYGRYYSRYSDTFTGWYWVWEVDNLNYKEPGQQDALAKALNINIDHLNQIDNRLPFMLCPFMNVVCSTAEEYRKLWVNVFAKTHFRENDIFCPQDCVGAGGLQMNNFEEWLAALGEAVDTKHGLKYWIDVETFDQSDWTSATIKRFVRQLQAAGRVAENAITFAYSHYYSPSNNVEGYHNAYLYYVKTGKLLGEAPEGPSNLRVRKQEDGKVLLQWDPPLNTINICGYNLYRNGTLMKRNQIARLEKGIENVVLHNEIADDVSEAGDICHYEVKSYDFTGNVSKESAKAIYRIR